MSHRHVISPDTAFAQALASLTVRAERMEKRQRWQGAINGPIVISSAGWDLDEVDPVASSTEIEAVAPGAWLVLSFCYWSDTGSSDGYTFAVQTIDVSGFNVLDNVGSIAVPVSGSARFLSPTFAARIIADEPFRIQATSVGDVTETESLSGLVVTTLAFPG